MYIYSFLQFVCSILNICIHLCCRCLGYLWIDGGHHVSHLTGPVHKFTVRDSNREDVFTVSLAPAPEEEL